MQTRTFTDQLGRLISLPYPPKRIISLVPSQTEFLYDIGLAEEIVGVTKFCVHPRENTRKQVKIGGTKTLDLARIRELQPDLIIGNREENERSQIEELMLEFPVWMSDIFNLDEALDMMSGCGSLTNKEEEANRLVAEIQKNFSNLQPINPIRCAYFIWKDPYMLAGRATFIDDMLMRSGFQNVCKTERYPEITIKVLHKLKPEILLLSSEPYPFKEKHRLELAREFPDAQIRIVDGELFSWYGSRLRYSAAYLKELRRSCGEKMK